MSDYVVDSSVLAKWVLPEPDSWQAERFVTDLAAQGAHMIVIDLAVIETTNAIRTRHHRGMATIEEAEGFLESLFLTPLKIEQAVPLVRPAFQIALKFRLAIYDALFVALTQHLQLPGITADEPLWNAVKTDFPNIILLRDWPVSIP